MNARRLLKGFHYGEKGFTLIELLIVVVILGILAAVVVPNLTTFLGTGKVAAANTEVAAVETAALAYYADNNGVWPTGTNLPINASLRDPPGAALPYLNKDAVDNYGFDIYGKVVPAVPLGWGGDLTIVWDSVAHKWKKA